ncbi:hypothetical protein MIND_00181900 [Mycena indigotica]|uniref:Uncharacterized protein n=1 Tax=Mycena indigotica TaxID=2126181 RepID=A0A8H6T445_9AGAR|nr:uncharacterized protein MIND_00181900 [Mycena indigotica]KAF7311720.1 hypothetical protein MIND_00181900 [Mycena indigotica]
MVKPSKVWREATPLEQLDRLLSTCPHIAPAVRRLTISCRLDGEWVAQPLAAKVIRRFTALDSLVVNCHIHGDTSRTWESFHGDTMEALARIVALPSIRSLTIRSTGLQALLALIKPPSPTPHPLRVRHLVLRDTNFDREADNFIMDDFPKLRLDSLECDPLHEPDGPFFERIIDIPALKHVHFTFQYSVYDAYEAQELILQHALDLEHLKITLITFDDYNDVPLLALGHLHELHTLELDLKMEASSIYAGAHNVVLMLLECIPLAGDKPPSIAHVIIGISALKRGSSDGHSRIVASLEEFLDQLVSHFPPWADHHFTPALMVRLSFESDYGEDVEIGVKAAVRSKLGAFKGLEVGVELIRNTGNSNEEDELVSYAQLPRRC